MAALHPEITSEGPWDPWVVLADRGDSTRLVYLDLNGRRGAWQRDHLGDLIALDVELEPIDRRAVLAHELVHAERGIGWGAATSATMQREEAIVRDLVASRLVPERELRALLADRAATEPLDVAGVAEHFGVPHDVARLALDRLRRHPR
jgi:Zn-dependent peptidase ImmA (M78 family)